MAKPVYILCCEFSLEDKSGLLTYVNVIEKVLFRHPAEQAVSATPQMRIFAIWKADNDDLNQKYDFELNVVFPDTQKSELINRGEFVFSPSMQRLVTHLIGSPPIEGPGTMRFQSRIRKAGTEEWIMQEYCVEFEETPASSPAPIAQPA